MKSTPTKIGNVILNICEIFLISCLLSLLCLFGIALIKEQGIFTGICYYFSLLFLILFALYLYLAKDYQNARYANQLTQKKNFIEGKEEANIKKLKPFAEFLFKKRRIISPTLILTALFVLCVFSALIPCTYNDSSPVLSVIAVVRLTMQMFLVDGGIEDFIIGGNQPFLTIYNCYVAVLCVAAGLLFTFNVISLVANGFKAYLNYCLMHPYSDIYVMSELNERSVILAESIFLYSYENKTSNPRIYFCNVNKEDKEKYAGLVSRVWRFGGNLITRPITELRVKHFSKSNEFFLISKNEDVNVACTLDIYRKFVRKNTNKKLKMYVYASSPESELIIDDLNIQINKNLVNIDVDGKFGSIYKKIERIENKIYKYKKKNHGTVKGYLYASKEKQLSDKKHRFINRIYDIRDKDKPKIRRIDEHYKFALDFFWNNGYDFFEKLKVASSEIQVYKVAFIGFGDYAYEILKVLCALSQLPRCRLIIYVFDKEAEAKKAKFQPELLEHVANKSEEEEYGYSGTEKEIAYHDMPFYEIHFVSADVTENSFSENITKAGFTHLFFILGDDDMNINVSMKARVSFERENEKPEIYAMVKDDDITMRLKAGVRFKEYNIHAIGANFEKYAFKNIIANPIEEIAKKIHKSYAVNKIIAELYQELQEDNAYLFEIWQSNPWGENLRTFIFELNALKDDILRKWRSNPDIEFNIIDGFIDTAKIKYSERLEIIKSKAPKTEKDNIGKILGCLEETIEKFKRKIVKLWDKDLQEREFFENEYFRRSSKSRALFEKLLFNLGFLNTVTEDNEQYVIIRRNLAEEFGIGQKEWDLNPDKSATYLPKNIPFYLKYKNAAFLKDTPYKKISQSGCKTEHINGQWFELNNILHKRWMVFRWSEGYKKGELDNGEPRNVIKKTHAFLIPYIEVYLDDYKRLRHTLYVFSPSEKDIKDYGYDS